MYAVSRLKAVMKMMGMWRGSSRCVIRSAVLWLGPGGVAASGPSTAPLTRHRCMGGCSPPRALSTRVPPRHPTAHDHRGAPALTSGAREHHPPPGGGAPAPAGAPGKGGRGEGGVARAPPRVVHPPFRRAVLLGGATRRNRRLDRVGP